MNPRPALLRLAAAIAVTVGLTAAPTGAQTAFGVRWFGESLTPAPPRTLALGGLSAVAPWGREPVAVGMMNPAVNALAERVLYTVTWEIGRLSGTYGERTGALNRSGPRLAGIVLPLGGGFAFSGGLQRVTASDFEIHTSGTVGADLDVRYDYLGTGGLNRGWAGVAWKSRSGLLAAGLSTELLFGVFKQKWAVNFESSGYIDTRDSLHRQHRGTRWSAGVQVQPLSSLRLGAALTSAPRLDVTWIASSVATGADTSEGRLELGRSLALSAGWSLNPVWALYLDFGSTAWNRTKWISTPPDGGSAAGVTGEISAMQADSEIGFGLERRSRPLAEQVSFIDSFPLRFGVRAGQFYAPDPAGGTVSRFSAMLGTAFYIGGGERAWGDIALQIGRYSADNGDREMFWRVTIGVSGAERWFQPPQR